jgi:hypothetical protein
VRDLILAVSYGIFGPSDYRIVFEGPAEAVVMQGEAA